MKTWNSSCKLMAVALLVLGAMMLNASAKTLSKVTNVSPNPTLTNEFYLTATNITTSINGTNVRVLIYMDDPPGGGGSARGIPGPLVEAAVGQMIVCHFKNNLTNNFEGATVHWHGLELDNDSDGTAVTQDTVLSGQTYTYRFRVPRAGLYWYHSHMLPGTTTFGGMYGPIVIHDTNETALMAANILPSTNYTFPIMFSDISFTNGTVGKVVKGTNYSLNTLIQICESITLGNLPATFNFDWCGPAGQPGDVALVNGTVPILAFTVFSCIPNTNSTPIFHIGNNQRVRLQLFNASISRDYNLTLRYPCFNSTSDTNLYHIGGQGGLLDSAVLDGGVQSGYDFIYPKGTIDIGTGMRSDVMFYASGNNGDVIQLINNQLPSSPWGLSGGLPANYPVAFFVITNGGATNLPLAAGSPILTAIGMQNENLRLLNTNALIAPPNPSIGTSSSLIIFSNGLAANANTNLYSPNGPTIGGYAAIQLDGNSGFGSWPDVKHPPTALWTRIGDVLQLAIANDAQSGGGNHMHPYHLHGFSMQPVSIFSSNLKTNLYNFPYNQFVDTYEIYPNQALVFRIKLTDRPKFADTATGGPYTTGTDGATGGGLGRWLMHCHIFLHGAIGMISELVVLPNTVTRLVGPAAGTNSVIFADNSTVPWTATADVSWLHPAPGFASGTGSATVRFTYDANPGALRVGNFNVGGKTVVVTQAGINYIKAPGPLTTLVTNLSGPTGIAADDDGNVYFSDGGHGALKRWNPSNNTVTTLASGYGNLQGLGLDGLGNVYFADFSSPAIRRWSASTHVVSNLFNNPTTGVSGLAVDNAGNVYITVPGQNAVKKWTAATGVLTTYTTNGLSSPFGVAVDAAGSIYVADTANDAVKQYGFTVVFFGGIPFLVPNWNTVVASNNLNSPWNLAVDDGGNIYIADGFHNAIKRFNYASNLVETLVASGLGDPTGVAVDSSGNTYISDFNNGAIKELPYAYLDPRPQSEPAELTVDTLPGILLPTQNLLPPFTPTPNAAWIFYGGSTTGVVQFAVSANTGAPRTGTLTVLGTNITINQDGAAWKLASTNLLVGPALGSNTVTEQVIPSIGLWGASTATPWLNLPFASGTGSANILFTYDKNTGATRTGTITINGQVLTVTQAGVNYVSVLAPATLVSAGLVNPLDAAPDPFGNVIFTDSGNNTVKKWTPGTTNASLVFSNGLNTPQGVAVDAVGNIYVAEFFNHDLKQWRAADSNVVTFVTTSTAIEGVDVDAGGNVYWATPSGFAINKWVAATSNTVLVVGTNLSGPRGVAVDIAGNVYIADTSGNALKKWNPVTASLTTLVASGLNSPWDCAVDGCGNIYVANGFNNNVVEWVAASGSVVSIVPGGLVDPTGVGVDANQNLFIADIGNGAVKELPHAFIDPTTKLEPATAGSDTLPVVLPPGQNLSASFAPTDNAPWLTITSTNGGIVSFSFTANPNTVARAATISLLGQTILVNQDAAIYPPLLSNPSMPTNGVFQFGFTNGTRGANYSVLFSTNVAAPLINWTVIGVATQINSTLWQFADGQASNQTRFYRLRSP